MLVAGFPAGVFATNCWIIAPSANSEAVIVDPGMDAREGIADLVARHGLRPIAVLLTHGHLDHMWSVTPVADGYGTPAWVHPSDRHLLADPLAGMSDATRTAFGHLIGEVAEPAEVRELVDGAVLELAGLNFTARHAPGHTEGSTVFEVSAGEAPLLLTGDVLFAGSIGRTDLPGGDPAKMARSLQRVILPQPDQAQVLPGHGPTTTIGAERSSNPYLAGPGTGLGWS